MSEPVTQSSLVSSAEHDALRAAHAVAMHRVLIAVLLVAAGLSFLGYRAYRDVREAMAAQAAEKALRAVIPGAPAQPIVIQVPTTPIVQPSGFLGRGGGSGRAFNRRQVMPAATKPGEVRQADAKSGAVTVVDCPTGKPTTAVTTDGRGIVTTAYACPPAPPPPSNVTRFDPPTEKDRKAIEQEFRVSFAKVDMLGLIDAPRTRTNRRYGAFVPKAGGDLDVVLHEEPRPNFERGRYFELYGAIFRQSSFNSQALGTASAPGYGGALGVSLDALRWREMHFQPYGEASFVSPAVELRYGFKISRCVGAVCP